MNTPELNHEFAVTGYRRHVELDHGEDELCDCPVICTCGGVETDRPGDWHEVWCQVAMEG